MQYSQGVSSTTGSQKQDNFTYCSKGSLLEYVVAKEFINPIVVIQFGKTIYKSNLFYYSS